MEFYQPGAIVLQCGADSLSGDRLGSFNLSMSGHANCVTFVQSFKKPTLVLGGGGYTIRNVSRAWAYETGQLVGVQMARELPFTDYYEYYAPDFELDVLASNMNNANTPEYLARIKAHIYENLRRTQAAPSVALQEVPRFPMGMDEDIDQREERLNDEEADRLSGKDQRYTQRALDKKVQRDDELSESADDEDLISANEKSKRSSRQRRRAIMDFPNPWAAPDTLPTATSPEKAAPDVSETESHTDAEGHESRFVGTSPLISLTTAREDSPEVTARLNRPRSAQARLDHEATSTADPMDWMLGGTHTVIEAVADGTSSNVTCTAAAANTQTMASVDDLVSGTISTEAQAELLEDHEGTGAPY